MSGSHLRLMHLLQHGRHAELETAARTVLAADREDSLSWIYLGQALLGQQKLAPAGEAARKAISLSPESDGGYYLLALVLLERNQPEEALTAARDAVSLDPADSLNHALTARALNQLSRYTEAAAAAEAGLQAMAGCDSCLFQLSQAKSFLGHHEEADQVTRALLADDPEDATNHCARGYHLLLAGHPSQARQHFLEALRLQPNNPDAHHGLAQSLTNRNAVFRLGLKVMLHFKHRGWKGFLPWRIHPASKDHQSAANPRSG